jgi:hypothetical protein
MGLGLSVVENCDAAELEVRRRGDSWTAYRCKLRIMETHLVNGNIMTLELGLYFLFIIGFCQRE